MKQVKYGIILFVFLALPPVANLLESIMIVHMHMQMPLLVFSGFLMAPFFQMQFPSFFKDWNHQGIPGIFIFVIIWSYWMIPRLMDEALLNPAVELFKFISLPFLAGVFLRDSWFKLRQIVKDIVFVYFIFTFLVMAGLYIGSDSQICNNYLLVEQQTLGWGSLAIAICIMIYFVQLIFIRKTQP